MAKRKNKRCKKPSKPYPSFPLTAHNNGQWCKKIRGKINFFGVWDNPQTALDNYLRNAADLQAGRQVQTTTLQLNGPDVKEVCNHFLNYQYQKAEGKEITMRWFEDCRRVIESFARFISPTYLACDLGPDDFRRFRQRLISDGLNGKSTGLGVYALNRSITVVKGMFKYAYEMDLIDKPIKYGRAFEKASATLKRKHRQAVDQENGRRLFSATEILTMLDVAMIPLRAMILLGLNGGFGNTDCACLPIVAVDLKRALIDFRRTKTGIERLVPLWPETVAALQEALAGRSDLVDAEMGKQVFLTPSGLPWVRERVHRTDEQSIKKVVLVDDVCREFGKLITGLGLKRKGVGFYALRHTFRTWADEVKDQHAIHRIMGHAIPGMSGIYVERIELDRLWAVVNHVREKLFSNENEGSSKE